METGVQTRQIHKQSRVVDVERGLLLVRYAAAEDTRHPPKVKIVVNPRHEGHIELVSNPLHQDAMLWQPGSCLVVRAMRPGQVFVEVLAREQGGSTAATVQIETLSQGEAPVVAEERRPAVAQAEASERVDRNRLRILGHVAGIGDVTVRPDAWVAGPASPARIEGLSISWPGKPDNVDIRYSVKLARPHASSGQIMELGGYAGTRGRSLPIVAVTLELTGPGAADLRLATEAAFLGAPVMRMAGKQIELSGPTGREPLVGFRLRLDDATVAPQPVLAPVLKEKASGRVRVFRSQVAEGRVQARPEIVA